MVIGVGNGQSYVDLWMGIGVSQALGGIDARILRARLAIQIFNIYHWDGLFADKTLK